MKYLCKVWKEYDDNLKQSIDGLGEIKGFDVREICGSLSRSLPGVCQLRLMQSNK